MQVLGTQNARFASVIEAIALLKQYRELRNFMLVFVQFSISEIIYVIYWFFYIKL